MKAARFSALLLAALAVSGEAAPAQPKGQAAACAVLEKLRENLGVPGMTAAVGRSDGSIVEFALGRSEGDGAPIQPDAKFLSGSIGKTYAAALAIDLHENGLIDLDAPVKDLLGDEDWYRGLPNADRITLRQLLNHSSGMPTHVEEPGFQKAITERIHQCPECMFTPLEAVRFVDGKKALFEPGQGWAYSETGYLVAGFAIEKAMKRPYYTLLRERVLTPLGLKDTVPSDRNDIPGLVSGRMTKDDNYFDLHPAVTMAGGRLRYNPGLEWTGGGLAATSADLVRWARLLYTGRAFPEPYLQDLFTSAPTGQPGVRYGLGVGIQGRGLKVAYGHTGSIPGYGSGMRFYPATGVAVAAQANGNSDDSFDSVVPLVLKAADLVSRPQKNTLAAIRCD